MPDKQLRAPSPRGGARVRERWELNVSKKLDNTTFSLDDAFRALLLTTGTTQGQENENELRYLERMIADNSSLRGRMTDLERKVRDLEKIIWR